MFKRCADALWTAAALPARNTAGAAGLQHFSSCSLHLCCVVATAKANAKGLPSCHVRAFTGGGVAHGVVEDRVVEESPAGQALRQMLELNPAAGHYASSFYSAAHAQDKRGAVCTTTRIVP